VRFYNSKIRRKKERLIVGEHDSSGKELYPQPQNWNISPSHDLQSSAFSPHHLFPPEQLISKPLHLINDRYSSPQKKLGIETKGRV
jgi:hypothetical protein